MVVVAEVDIVVIMQCDVSRSDICILYDVTLHCHHLSLRSYKIVRTFSPDNQHTLVLVSTVPAHMNNLKINIDPSNKRKSVSSEKNKERRLK